VPRSEQVLAREPALLLAAVAAVAAKVSGWALQPASAAVPGQEPESQPVLTAAVPERQWVEVAALVHESGLPPDPEEARRVWRRVEAWAR
jgi:hypothetical protein